jgi:hypothetical protein
MGKTLKRVMGQRAPLAINVICISGSGCKRFAVFFYKLRMIEKGRSFRKEFKEGM